MIFEGGKRDDRKERERERDEPEHVRHDEEPHVRTPDVHLVEMADAAVARGHRDILELNIHVVLGCRL
jgi:hypothetical protein